MHEETTYWRMKEKGCPQDPKVVGLYHYSLLYGSARVVAGHLFVLCQNPVVI